MRTLAVSVASALPGLLATSALAQTTLPTDVPGPPFEGLRWAVTAPASTAWSLACRFRPVTYRAGQYNLHQWTNGTTLTGRGPDQGRLPGPDGRCVLTLTDGPARSVSASPAKGVDTVSAGTNDPATPARATVF
jgi:hypothetical protein